MHLFTVVWMLSNTSTGGCHHQKLTKEKEEESKVSDNNKHGEAGGSCKNMPLEGEAKAEAALQMAVVCAAIKHTAT